MRQKPPNPAEQSTLHEHVAGAPCQGLLRPYHTQSCPLFCQLPLQHKRHGAVTWEALFQGCTHVAPGLPIRPIQHNVPLGGHCAKQGVGGVDCARAREGPDHVSNGRHCVCQCWVEACSLQLQHSIREGSMGDWGTHSRGRVGQCCGRVTGGLRHDRRELGMLRAYTGGALAQATAAAAWVACVRRLNTTRLNHSG